jgi:NADH-quinone oxidoreductase subunit D
MRPISAPAASIRTCREAADRHRRLGSTRACRSLFDDAMSLVTDNRIFKQRNVDIGVVSKEDALLGLLRPDDARLGHRLGPAQVASPTTCYDRMEFDIPVGKNGDCYDRYLVRVEEMRQSRAS